MVARTVRCRSLPRNRGRASVSRSSRRSRISRRAQDPAAGGGDLHCQGDPVEGPAEVGDGLTVVVGEVGAGIPRPLEEQAHGTVLSLGRPEGQRADHDQGLARQVEGRPTGGYDGRGRHRTPAAHRWRPRRRRGRAHSCLPPAGRAGRRASRRGPGRRGSRAGRPAPHRRPRRHRPGSGRRSGPRAGTEAPGGRPRRAIVVLPIPPGPTTVTSRWSSRRSTSSSSSRSRPMRSVTIVARA